MNWFPAPGKLNLFLHLLGRRADGMHELQTVFRLVEHGDRVGIRVRGDREIRRHDPLPGVAVEDDLCVRAARLLQTESGTAQGADLALDKRLPIGGGKKLPEGQKPGDHIRLYQHFKPAVSIKAVVGKGGHGGGDDALYRDLFAKGQ